MNQSLWMLLAKDTPNPRGFPPDWPIGYSYTSRPAPWIKTTKEGLEDQRAAHRAAWDAWVAAHKPTPGATPPDILQGEGGKKWKIGPAGKLIPA